MNANVRWLVFLHFSMRHLPDFSWYLLFFKLLQNVTRTTTTRRRTTTTTTFKLIDRDARGENSAMIWKLNLKPVKIKLLEYSEVLQYQYTLLIFFKKKSFVTES